MSLEGNTKPYSLQWLTIFLNTPVYIDYCLTMHRVLDDPKARTTRDERDAMQQIRDHAYSKGETFHPDTFTKDDLVASAFAGMTPEEFRAYVVDFADNTEAVGFTGMTYGQSFYKPMIEVINYLKANDFDVWMVSACEREVFAQMADLQLQLLFFQLQRRQIPLIALHCVALEFEFVLCQFDFGHVTS